MSTVKAAFGRRVPLVNLDEGPSIPLGFILQLPGELTPSDIRDGFCQRVVFDHMLDLQTLDTYDLVFAYDASRELVLIVSSSIGNLLMDASDFETSLVPVLGAFFLFRMPSLCLCQFLFIRGREFGVTMGLSIGGDHHRLQAQIKSNRLRSNFQWLHVFFYQDGNKVAFSVIFGDGDTTWLASIGQGTVPYGGKRGLHLRQREMMPVPAKRIARIGSGLLLTFLFEGGIVSTSFEEVAKSFIKMPESLLQRNRRNLTKP